MLEYLILNNRLQAAYNFNKISQKGFEEEIIDYFHAGLRQQFFRIYDLFGEESKLEFYLRVYFLIYQIHPSLNSQTDIPQVQIESFKQYLNNKGSHLAKTKQFLQFYALPYIKKHNEHPTFKKIFTIEWVNNLQEKLHIFLNQCCRKMKERVAKLVTFKEICKQSDNNQIKQMEKKNKQLFQQVKKISEKYQFLEQNHKILVDSCNNYMLQSQSKWLQITKQLVNCSNGLIKMIMKCQSDLARQRVFMMIKKKINKYQKFVNKKVQQLMDQSIDISILDKSQTLIPPSITQKNITTHFNIQQYIPTNITKLNNDFNRMNKSQKQMTLYGFVWRIIKSKNKLIQRHNISCILLASFITGQNHNINQILLSRQLLIPCLSLLSVISCDGYGRISLYKDHNLITNLMFLLKQSKNDKQIDLMCIIFEQLTVQKQFQRDLIGLGIVKVMLNLLKSNSIKRNQTIVENIVACLLNLSQTNQGLQHIKHEDQIFVILAQFLSNSYAQLVRLIVTGIIFSLVTRSFILFKLAEESQLSQYVNKLLKYQNKNVQLKLLSQKLATFEKSQIKTNDIQQVQEDNLQESINYDYSQFENMEQLMKGHQFLVNNYRLDGKQAFKQLQTIKFHIHNFDQNKNSLSQSKYKSNSKQKIVQTKFYTDRNQKSSNQSSQKKPLRNRIYSEKLVNNLIESAYQTPHHHQQSQQKTPIYTQYKINKSPLSVKKQISNSQLIYHHKAQFISDKKVIKPRPILEQQIWNKSNEGSSYKKKARQDVLKQINQQTKQQRSNQKIQNQNKNISFKESQPIKSVYIQSRKSGSSVKVNKQYIEVFSSKPKLRRTPPKDDQY